MTTLPVTEAVQNIRGGLKSLRAAIAKTAIEVTDWPEGVPADLAAELDLLPNLVLVRKSC